MRPYPYHLRTFTLLSLLAGLALPVMPATLRAQRAAITCDSARLLASHGTGEEPLRAMLRRAPGGRRLDPRFAIGALDAIRRHFEVPAQLALPIRVPLSDTVSTFAVAASVDFTATRDGSIRAVRMTRSSYVAALDSAIVRALEAAGAESAFAPFDSSDTADALRLVMDVGFGLEDSTRAGIDVALLRLPRHARLELPTVIEPQRLPTFPNARAAGSQLGRVTMEFAVSAEGQVLPGTVEFTRVTTPALARAVLDVLPSWRFTPARIAGCPVPALVSQSFSFAFP